MSVLANMSKNKDLTFEQTTKKIDKLLSDRELKCSLNVVGTMQFSMIRKLLIFLMKNNQTKIIYLLIKNHSILRH